MSDKRDTKAEPRHTANYLSANSPGLKYGGNKEFNQWWEHWMSKVRDSRSPAKGTLMISNRTTYPIESDETMQEKDAA
jgi:hypothetical protein